MPNAAGAAEGTSAHFTPAVQVLSATRYLPFDPTVSADGVEAAVPTMRSPFAAMQAQGIASGGGVTQVSPEVQAAHAVRI